METGHSNITDSQLIGQRQLQQATHVPPLVDRAGPVARKRFIEFFTAEIRNRGTRDRYARAVGRFAEWCDEQGLELVQIAPVVVATYIELLTGQMGPSAVKMHLAAIRKLFDYLVVGQVISANPAASVRGPKYVVKHGKTPVLAAAEARELLDSADTTNIKGLRDRALVAVMVYSFARVSAVVGMDVGDYFSQGRRMWFRFHEKGSKIHDVPAHHNAEEYVDQYLDLAGIKDQPHGPLFRTIDRQGQLTLNRLHRNDVLRMIKLRAQSVGLRSRVCCHTMRATGITTYLENGGLLEHAQRIANHESVRTTKLYDRTSDVVSLDEIERIQI
ncbi:MAG: tyrosine-type recombinase/integrase [Planctomycetales bacterium]|nr:tyrosine-type recombinase/integrase [Planctomycetales bacterium]